ncbi:hypothetical protein [Streptomyces catenulae]|uniref:Integral membrane protein n=1 Tax=Streptomyces catenulae TaxID=66875 RepID=A0ABV2YUX9_9ACTN|nr:hypothetical protein [Streptomyces catenulae]
MGTTRTTTDERDATRTDDPSVTGDTATETPRTEGKDAGKPAGDREDAATATDEQDGADRAEGTGADAVDTERTEDAEDAAEQDGAADGAAPAPTGVKRGAGAVVAAGLGLASVTGTWLGTLLAERQTLLGQIKLQSGKATDQIATVYGAPWHTTALINGVFALLAVAVGAAVLFNRPRATWTRAVAWGGLALGVLGLLISAGMYFDLLASLPTIPKAPTQPPAG